MTTMNERKHHALTGRRMQRAYSLTDVVTTVMAVGVVVTLLGPTLITAAERSRSSVCLNNLRNLGVAIRSYAEQSSGYLPGPCHPAVSHGMLEEGALDAERSLVVRLRQVLGTSITDRLVTCPTMASIVPDSHFTKLHETTGKPISPVHYVLNNYGIYDVGQPSALGGYRSTNPLWYFGIATWASDWAAQVPKKLGAIPNPSREWMIADGWYRPRSFPEAPEFQQEGPFQSVWTGESLPNFAPHQLRQPRSYVFTTSETRAIESSRIRKVKADGVTNTLYFDGHAAPSVSRSYIILGREYLYGYRGTVNPARFSLPPDSPAWNGVWR